MSYGQVLENSPKGDDVRRVLEICDSLDYPPSTWKQPTGGGSKNTVTRFLSALEKLTGKAQGPAHEGLSFSWNPDELRSRSAEFLAIHKAVIFKELSRSQGVGNKIDLFKWFWKGVIEEYIDSIANLNKPDELSSIDLSYGPTTNYNLDEETHADWGPIFEGLDKKSFFDDMDRISGGELGFTTAFCKPPSYYREDRTLLSEAALDKIRGNQSVKVRLLLWWGWPGAPFFCMQDMVAKHIEHLVEEGYLRQTNAPSHPRRGFVRQPDARDNIYEITNAGRQRLDELDPGKKLQLVECVKGINLIDLGNLISSVCAQLFPR